MKRNPLAISSGWGKLAAGLVTGWACLMSVSAFAVVVETEAEFSDALSSGEPEITLAAGIELTLAETLVVTNDVAIDSEDMAGVLSGDNAVQILSISNATVSLTGITFKAGNAAKGGAIFIGEESAVSITNCLFLGNEAVGQAGEDGEDGRAEPDGIGGDGRSGTSGTPGWGGAIYIQGALTIAQSQFITNTAAGGNGGQGGLGGNGRFGGGNGGNGGNGALGFGGALYTSETAVVELIDSYFQENVTLGGNGGEGGTGGGGSSGAFAGRPGIGGAGSPAAGSAIYSLGEIIVNRCTFDSNSTEGGTSADGGVAQSQIGTDGKKGGNAAGGAVFLGGPNTGVTNEIINSTFYGNKVVGGDGGNGGGSSSAWEGGNGGNGGDAVGGAICSSNAVHVLNCTVSKNQAFGGTNGVTGPGAFRGSDGKPGAPRGGGIANVSSGILYLTGTIVVTNTGGNLTNLSGGTFHSGGYNLVSDKTHPLLNDGTSLTNKNPKLGLLNGEDSTYTMAIAPSSPAKDAMPADLAPETDQRGVERPVGDKADIGAYEYDAEGPPSIMKGVDRTVVQQSTPALLSVSATGGQPLSYQWFRNGEPINGATMATLNISNATPTDAAAYSVHVTNTKGSPLSVGSLDIAPILVWGDNSSGQANVPHTATNVAQLAAGANHVIVLRKNGTLLAWGQNTSGQTNVPAAATNVFSIAGGAEHSLALRQDGTLIGWGNNAYGQTNASLYTNVAAIAAGAYHNLVIIDEAVFAWGAGTNRSATARNFGQSMVPPQAVGVRAVAAGDFHSLALTTNGTVLAWGFNNLGQVDVPTNLPPAKEIAAGAAHSLALLTNGTVRAWGDNFFGQSSVPAGLTNVVWLAAGSNFSLALTAQGKVHAWGQNSHGQTFVPRTLPVLDMAAGRAFAVALVDPLSTDSIPEQPPVPSITTQPEDVLAVQGSRVTLTVGANTNAAPAKYQWTFMSTNLPSSTTASLVLPSIQTSQAGKYAVRVSNNAGAVTSQVVTVRVLADWPQIGAVNTSTGSTLNLQTEIGLTYTVEGTGDLGSKTWTNVSTTIGNGSIFVVPVTNSNAFYRIRVQPAQ